MRGGSRAGGKGNSSCWELESSAENPLPERGEEEEKMDEMNTDPCLHAAIVFVFSIIFPF